MQSRRYSLPLYFCAILCACELAAFTPRAGAQSTWTNVTPAAITNLGYDLDMTGLAYGNGVFVAIGTEFVASEFSANYHTAVFTSTDGTNWVQVPLIVGYTDNYGTPSVRFVNGKFYFSVTATGVYNFAGLYSSTNGTSWVQAGSLPTGSQAMADLTVGNGIYVLALPDDSSNVAHPLVSTDLLHWTKANLPAVSSYDDFNRVAFSGGQFILATEDYYGQGEVPMYTSADGVTWHGVSNPTPDYDGTYSLAAGNGIALLQDYYDTPYTSVNGAAWSPAAGPADYWDPYVIRFAGNRFVAQAYNYVTSGSEIYLSVDGQNWVDAASLPTSVTATDFATDGKGKYVALVGNNLFSGAVLDVNTLGSAAAADVVGALITPKAKLNTTGTKCTVSGYVMLSNLGGKSAKDATATLYLSTDPTLDAGATTYTLGTLTLADLGFPTIAKKGKTTGPLPFKFKYPLTSFGAPSGMYLVLDVAPAGVTSTGAAAPTSFAYGPLP